MSVSDLLLILKTFVYLKLHFKVFVYCYKFKRIQKLTINKQVMLNLLIIVA